MVSCSKPSVEESSVLSSACSASAVALLRHCPPSSSRAVRPASLAASARHSLRYQSPVKLAALCSQAWARHVSKTAGFVHAGLSVHGPVSDHFTPLPVSQRLKPQSSMSERFCTSPFVSSAQRVCRSLGSQGRCASLRVSSSQQGCVGSQQPPNPSFKRTHKGLRPLRSA